MASSSDPRRPGHAILSLETLAPLFGPPEGAAFTAIMSDRVANDLDLTGFERYETFKTVIADGPVAASVIAGLTGGHHVLTITSDAPFVSPPAEAVTNIKLAVIPLFSTGYSRRKLVRVVEVIQSIDFRAQAERAAATVRQLSAVARLVFRGKFGFEAELTLSHKRPIHLFDQSSNIGWGHQSVLPGGEVSLLTNGHGQFSGDSRFQLDGVLELSGYPVLHRGQCPCADVKARHLGAREPIGNCSLLARPVSDAELRRRFARLAWLRGATVLLEIRDGAVSSVRGATKQDWSAAAAFEAMLSEDPNYAKIHEIGIGLIPSADWFLEDDFLPNEMREGVHFGFGLTPFTRFHLDIVCCELRLLAG